MAQTTMTLRVDNSLKKNFDTLEIKAASKEEVNAKGREAILEMGKQAEDAGIQDMSLEEINAIIKEIRDAR